MQNNNHLYGNKPIRHIKELKEVAELDSKINICVYNELHNQHYKEIQFKFWKAIDAIQSLLNQGESDERNATQQKPNRQIIQVSQYQRLFNAISETKGIPIQSEMDEIIRIVKEDFN